MNILYVNAYFSGGGAEKVARQLFYGLKEGYGINTFFIAGKQFNVECNKGINGIYNYDKPIVKIINRVRNLISNNERISDSYSRLKILSYIKRYHIDIVHFHNIHGNYIGIRDIGEISKYCKVVWTLHDMWALTGHCAYSLRCNNWINSSCRNCVDRQLYPKMFIDVAKRRYYEKRNSFTDKNITFVTPSKWLIDQCDKTFLNKEQKFLIYNGVNTNIYFPLDKDRIRKKYKISNKKVVLLFVANSLDSPYKGMDIINKALCLVDEKEMYELVIVGKGERFSFSEEYHCHYTGYIDNDIKMNELYNLADVFVLPSQAENFPCSILESMSAGTPVIASAVGGIAEQIDEKTGWLFESGNYRQLAQIINMISNKNIELRYMGMLCRKKVEALFSEEMMLRAYQKLYQELGEMK